MRISQQAIAHITSSALPTGRMPLYLRQIASTVIIPALEAELQERGIDFPKRVRHEDGQKRLYLLVQKFIISELEGKEFTLIIKDNTIEEIFISVPNSPPPVDATPPLSGSSPIQHSSE